MHVGQEAGMGDSGVGDVWQRSLFMLVHEKHEFLKFLGLNNLRVGIGSPRHTWVLPQ